MTRNRSLLLKAAVSLSMVCSICCGVAAAQVRKQSLSFDWGVAIPVGNSYIDKASAASFTLGWNYPLFPGLSAGVTAGYTGSCDRGVGNERFDSAFVTGYREKRLLVIPLMAHFDFFPLGEGGSLLRPYIGVAAGGRYAKFRITGDAIVNSVSGGWAESFSARLGTRIHPARMERLFLDAKCTWNYGGNRWPLAEVGPIQYLGISAGVGWMF